MLLLDSLCALMRAKDFEHISVADVAEAAHVNRATFYAHFPDKYALLDGLVTARFDEMLEHRGIVFSGCAGALPATILAACDYLESQPWAATVPVAPPPHVEAATIGVIRSRLLAGMRRRGTGSAGECGRAELIASTAAWAMYGAIREWLCSKRRVPAVEIVDTIRALVEPILVTAPWHHHETEADSTASAVAIGLA